MVLDCNKTFWFLLLWFDFSTECPKLDLADLKPNMKVPISIITIDIICLMKVCPLSVLKPLIPKTMKSSISFFSVGCQSE